MGKKPKNRQNVFINFDCVFLDLGEITIEGYGQIAPKVSFFGYNTALVPSDT